MASWTTPVLHSVGDILNVSDWNGVANNETFLYQAPYASAVNNAIQGVTGGSPVQVTNLVVSFSGYSFSLSSNFLVAPLTGLYHVDVFSTYLSSGSSQIGTAILHNGTFGQFRWVTETISSADVGTQFGDIVQASATDTLGIGTFTSLTQALTSGGSGISAFFIGSQ